MYKSELELLILDATKETALYPKTETFVQIAAIVNGEFNEFVNKKRGILPITQKQVKFYSPARTNYVFGAVGIYIGGLANPFCFEKF